MRKKMCYTLDKKNKDKLNLHKKQGNSKLSFRKDLEEFDYDFKKMLGWIYYPNFCYATIIDDKIVSCASAGYHADKVADNIIEISVKTNEDYKGKGYAVSNVAALCEYIFSMQEEKEAHYVTDVNNIASQKTALSAGLTKVRYSYILLRKLRAKLGLL